MEEKKRGLITLGVIAGLVFILLVAGVIQKENKVVSGESNGTMVQYKGQYSTEYDDAFTNEGKNLLYIGSSECGVCSAFNPFIKYLSEAYDFTYYYVDGATIDTEELKILLEELDQDIDDFGTPYLAFIENGTKYDELPGYVSELELFNNLQENGIIDSNLSYISSTEASNKNNETETEDEDSEYTSLSFIGYDEYKKLYDGSERFVLVLGQSGCGACTAYKPIINGIAEDNDIKIYYVDVRALTQSDRYSLMESLSYFDNIESWGTPLTLIVEDTKVIAYQESYQNKATTSEFLRTNEVIK